MKNNLIRISASVIAAFLFILALLYHPDNVAEPLKADVPKQTVKVSVKFKPAIVSAVSAPPEETTSEIYEEIIEPGPETETFTGSYLEVDSVSENLTLPEIDFKKVYSRIVYPASLRRKNIETSIALKVYVDKDGNISLQFPNGTNSAFISSIEKAFKGIKAKPAIYNGNPADVTFIIPIIFELQ